MTNAHYTLIIAYDGTAYFGWQANRELPTIERVLGKAIHTIFQYNASLDAASRTDRGVHAAGQVVAFTAPRYSKSEQQLQRSLNQLLPHDIRVLAVEETPSRLLPSCAARSKTYVYTIDTSPFQSPFIRHTAWHYPFPLSLSCMQEAAAALIGTHDFRAFMNEHDAPPSDTVRTLTSIELTQEEALLQIALTGNAFLYRMVRTIVGTLVEVGRGKRTSHSLTDILQKQKRALAGLCAPAHGLVLNQITY